MKFLLFFALCTLLKQTDAACYSGSSPVQCSDASCGGSCTSDNGCYCSDFITSCVPVSSQCPMLDNTCCSMLTDWYWDSSLSCCTDTMQCTPLCYSDEFCGMTGNGAGCLCNQTTYKELTPKNLVPTVTCDGGTMITSVSLCQLEQLGYNASSFHLTNSSDACKFTYNETINSKRVHSIQLRAAIGWCGNIVRNDSSTLYFTNTLHIDPFSGPLITKNPIVYNFTCAYSLTMQTSLNFSLNPTISSVVLPSPEAVNGFFTINMAAYSDTGFVVPIQQNEEILVGSNIYLGIFSPDLDGTVFVLRVDKCFATPTNNKSDSTKVEFISGGCAVNDEISSVVIKNGESNDARIQIGAFLFQGFTDLYIFCDVTICNKTNGDCGKCNTARSQTTDSAQLGIQLKLQDDYFSSSGHHTAASCAMLAASLLGLLFVKLF